MKVSSHPEHLPHLLREPCGVIEEILPDIAPGALQSFSTHEAPEGEILHGIKSWEGEGIALELRSLLERGMGEKPCNGIAAGDPEVGAHARSLHEEYSEFLRVLCDVPHDAEILKLFTIENNLVSFVPLIGKNTEEELVHASPLYTLDIPEELLLNL